MYIDDSLLSYEEDLGLRLRSLYQQSGYRRFTMGKFEEYDLYAQFRDFLPSEQVISFTDTTGKLMALKPDVTLFYAANNKVAPGAVGRVYYAENVYRVSKITGAFKEIMQVGVECLGAITDEDISRVLVLAARSLDTVSPANVMAITSLDILSEALDTLGLPEPRRAMAAQCMAKRNVHELEALCAGAGVAPGVAGRVASLLRLPQDSASALMKLEALEFAPAALQVLAAAVAAVEEAGFGPRLRIDFSLVNDTAYYNGLAFQGFVQGVPRAVLMGGQYDNLLAKLGRDQRAVGFAVYTDGIRSQA